MPNSVPKATPKDAKRILVVDDEPRMIGFIRMNLELEGHQVVEAHNGLEALEAVRTQLPDVILLDVMMPDIDGFETLRMLREFSSIPVIMLTAKGDENDKVYGLELGADDYVTKQAILKVDDHLSVDFNQREVIVKGERIKLRPTEYRLLYHLIENAGWTVPHDQLLAKVWGYEYRDEAHYVRLYVNYLREKIEEDPSNPHYILTERGVGYRFINFRKQDS
jgi:DNA-binding response OmpR family regulator